MRKPEHDAAREISAGLLVYAREVEAYADKYHRPELLRWVERLRADALDVVAQAERLTPAVVTKPKCGQKGCVLEAVKRVHWPGLGSPALACVEHGERARAVAGAMGMTLLIERLP